MDNYKNFRYHFYRTYPQVAAAAESLVTFYNNALSKIPPTANGALEIESLFGRRHYYANKTHPRFDNSLTMQIMKQLSSMLESFSEWDSITDWFIVYDYYASKTDRVRVKYVNNVQSVSCIRKHRLSQTDFAYGKDSKWALRDYLTRVNMKFEEEVPMVGLVNFKTVKISIRKLFTIASANVNRVSWTFEIVQYWTGNSLADAENAMKTTEPTWSLECEIVNIPSNNTLTEKDKFVMFASLLLKMQDFLDFPVFYDNISQNTDQALPVFTIV
jgi:hypothetical protein